MNFVENAQNLADNIVFDSTCLMTEVAGHDACRLPGLHLYSDIADIESVLDALRYLKEDVANLERLLRDRIEELSE